MSNDHQMTYKGMAVLMTYLVNDILRAASTGRLYSPEFTGADVLVATALGMHLRLSHRVATLPGFDHELLVILWDVNRKAVAGWQQEDLVEYVKRWALEFSGVPHWDDIPF